MMSTQGPSVERQAVFRVWLILGLALITLLVSIYLLATRGAPEGRTALVIGVLGIACGVGLLVFGAVKELPNTSLKNAFTLWGAMGVSAGVGAIGAGAGQTWLLAIAVIIGMACWLGAHRQLKKAVELMRQRQQQAPGE